jgi:hypothetical protein
MQRSFPLLLALLLPASLAAGAEDAKPANKPVRAAVDTTLATADKHIRQFAFDGDVNSYFLSAQNAGKADHFTLVFDRPVIVQAVTATTGRPQGGDGLDEGTLQVSTDGKKFEDVARFAKGAATGKLNGQKIQVVRIQPSADLQHPLAVRELTIDSEPAVAVFKFPVEFVIETIDDAALRPWFEKVARLCEHEYSAIAEELHSTGFKPRTVVELALKSDYDGVAATSGGRIIGSVKYFKSHPDDQGAFIHETVHVLQDYRTPGNPGWLVEGIADYIRFYRWEPMKPKPLKPDQAKYNGSYRTTAAFLAFLSESYDRDVVAKLNRAMREGEYQEEIFRVLTKKTVQELEQEWKASLKQ